eukprot:TRINITY_DN91484_c0_g1_i1.p1 TRINITY_DN91484_c0_g1~~TRINITY_DN91484_c0_g1_i1.p1  ORF type:complete len:825 (+),score=190.41 TRINITY_DN91484_c0_g1_i1:130-2604(+)
MAEFVAEAFEGFNAGLDAGNVDPGNFVAGVATAGRAELVSQEFDKKVAQIDYKIQRQALHREDIQDLCDLTVSRMDMFNLVGALLLTFSLQWITGNEVFGMTDWPAWFASAFVVNCTSSVGYLLFSLWFSMRCALTAQTCGTQLKLNFARYSVPTKKETKNIKVKFYDSSMEQMTETLMPSKNDGIRQARRRHLAQESDDESGEDAAPSWGQRLKGMFFGGTQAASSDERPRALGAGAGQNHDRWMRLADGHPHSDAGSTEEDVPLGCKNDSDEDFERHLRQWLCEKRKWLSYDAYSRACMVVGMNQLLQALAYNLISLTWIDDRSANAKAYVGLLASKLLSYHVLHIDIRQINASCFVVFFCEFLPPLYALTLLQVFPPGSEDDYLRIPAFESYIDLVSLLVSPIFLLHACWMFFLAWQLKESSQATNPFDSDDSEFSGSDSDGYRPGRRNAKRTIDDGVKYVPRCISTVFYLRVVELEQDVSAAESQEVVPAFDHLPARIVRSYTLFTGCFWLAALCLHLAEGALLTRAEYLRRIAKEESADNLAMKSVAPGTVWPQPAGLYTVKNLQCLGDRQAVVSNDFKTHCAQLPEGEDGLQLSPISETRIAAHTCDSNRQACAALAHPDENSTSWSLHTVPNACSSGSGWLDNSAATPVPLPLRWQLVTLAWLEAESCLPSATTECRWRVAAWDGGAVEVGYVQQVRGQGWQADVQFRLMPGLGACLARDGICSQWKEAKYDKVRALQFGPMGTSLMVLHDGNAADTEHCMVDGWHLESGSLLGRWRVGKQCTAMCAGEGSRLLVARASAAGPILEVADTPPVLVQR